MNNPFEIISNRLSNIESLLLDIKHAPQAADTALQDELLTIEQAAAFLSLSVPTLYTKTSTGQIPFMKRGKRLYFSRVELMEYLKAGRHKTHAEQIAEAGQHLKRKGGDHE
ncbi:MAG: helix-turn-helix domain-containing protein [Bacteroidales bacterium]